MNKNDYCIRLERTEEHRQVEHLIRESFWNVYRPGCLEHYVIHQLRNDPAFVPELDFVMEKDGQIIGQNMFMRAAIQADNGREIPIMTMGPICIAPEYKRQGYGKRLLDESLVRAAALGCGALCFEGNIQFYGKSGFTFSSEYGIRYHGLPEGADASFFLCRELVDGYLKGVTGEYAPPEGYYAAEQNPEAFRRFDENFPKKEKLRLPGQLFP
jgi:predicted N-acetyltransferase YhbS